MYNDVSDQVIREDPAGAVVVRAWPGHRNIGKLLDMAPRCELVGRVAARRRPELLEWRA